jgi:predicted permease
VRVAETRRGGTVNTRPVLSNATYLAWAEQATTIDALAGYSETTVTLDTEAGAERVGAARVTASLFPMLGVAPLVGPGFSAAEEERDLAVLSYGFWQERFGGAPDVVGQTLRLASGPVTVVGVMPAGFMFPTPAARLWLPSPIRVAIRPGGGSLISLFDAVARLKPGVTPAQAAGEAERAARALPDLGPVIPAVFGSKGEAVVVAQPLAEALIGDVRPALWILLAAVVLLWLAAVGNVASLQMAHAAARRREVAIRAAIGAGSRRLVRQLLVENAMLGVTGGAAGLLLTAALLRVLPALLPADFPRAETVAIDGRVFAFAAVLAIAASGIIALLPARLAAALDLRSAIAGDATADGASDGRHGATRFRGFIIAGQVAIAVVLLVGGMLLGRSFMNLWRLDRGFDSSNVLTARVQWPTSRDTGAKRLLAFDEVLTRIGARPGVRAVGLSDAIPLGGSERRFASTIVEPGRETRTVSALLREVTPGYFAAMGMRVSEGRILADTDTMTSEPVALVNRTFAQKYLSATPVGERLPIGIDNVREGSQMWLIVGVLDDVLRANAVDPVQPEIFVSVRQMSGGAGSTSYVTLRTEGDAAAFTDALRLAVHEVDRRATVDQAMTMDARLMRSLARPRLFAVLFGGFAAFAALVAMAGLFGGLSYGVTQRTREIGLRTALGATPWSIVRLIVAQGAVLTLAGLAVGLTAASLSARVLSAFLFGISAYDLASYVGVAAVLLVTALVACALPARRAASIDPLTGLRS